MTALDPRRPAPSGHAGPDVAVVVPTIGRPSLARLLDALAGAGPPWPAAIVLVDDRRDPHRALVAHVPPALAGRVRMERGRSAGPAAARNVGWRATPAAWIAFLDDDVVPGPDWTRRLLDDLAGLPADVAGSQGCLVVPRPAWRPPTDWERNVAGLETARWATADMAYRRRVLDEVGGFDERFPRAYREDADLALRVLARGHRLVQGERRTVHPVRPADRWISVRLQAGNRDDVLMAALHGRDWRARAGAPRGRCARHLATTAALLIGVAAALARRPGIAAAGLAAWLAGTAELAWARIAPGPRTREEIATMLLTSAVLPPAAAWHRLAGLAGAWRARGAGAAR
jgi:GT2 family glycosyltransferase